MQIKMWDWEKKEKTMRRFIKPGNIFCFQVNEMEYIFGRIIAKIPVGAVVEFFDYVKEDPNLSVKEVKNANRLSNLVIEDHVPMSVKVSESTSFDEIIAHQKTLFSEVLIINEVINFQDKLFGEWRIIGYQEDFTIPEDLLNIHFLFGMENLYKITDLFGNSTKIVNEDAIKYPRWASSWDGAVLKAVSRAFKMIGKDLRTVVSEGKIKHNNNGKSKGLLLVSDQENIDEMMKEYFKDIGDGLLYDALENFTDKMGYGGPGTGIGFQNDFNESQKGYEELKDGKVMLTVDYGVGRKAILTYRELFEYFRGKINKMATKTPKSEVEKLESALEMMRVSLDIK